MKARLSVPARARPGEVVAIKTLVSHPMESGFRLDRMGVRIPRNIITTFTCHYGEDLVFAAEFGPGVAANPFLEFFVRAEVTADLVFTWTDQHGDVLTERRRLTMVGD